MAKIARNDKQVSRLLTWTAVALLGGTLGVSPAVSASEAPDLVSEGDDNGGFQVNCLLPGYINCSFAIAVSVGGPYDSPVGRIYVWAWSGVVGGLSTVALVGGAAAGTVNGAPASCDWPGMSGGCADIQGSVGVVHCTTGLRVVAEGEIHPGIAAPPAEAYAPPPTNPCVDLEGDFALTPRGQEETATPKTADPDKANAEKARYALATAVQIEVDRLAAIAKHDLPSEVQSPVLDALAQINEMLQGQIHDLDLQT